MQSSAQSERRHLPLQSRQSCTRVLNDANGPEGDCERHSPIWSLVCGRQKRECRHRCLRKFGGYIFPTEACRVLCLDISTALRLKPRLQATFRRSQCLVYPAGFSVNITR